MNFSDLLGQIFTQGFVLQVIGIVLAVIADVAFGFILAIKNGVFDAQKAANFYKTTVLPYVLGWLVTYFMIKVISIYGLPSDSLIPVGIEVGAYSILMLTLGSGLTAKFVELWGKVPGKS